MHETLELFPDEPTPIILPEITFELPKFRIGYSFQLLRPKAEAKVLNRSDYQIGPRTNVDLLILDNVEKIILTT